MSYNIINGLYSWVKVHFTITEGKTQIFAEVTYNFWVPKPKFKGKPPSILCKRLWIVLPKETTAENKRFA